MMKITKAQFITSLAQARSYPGEGLPACAVVGRSNVGKSSLINKLCNRRDLARTGQTPGVTRMINIFLLNERFHLVDLPGYGFHQAGKERAENWGNLIEGFLKESASLKGVLQLVDIRHDPTQQDQQMIAWLRHYDIPFLVVATKADKIARAHHVSRVHAICRTLVVQPWEVQPFSSQTGAGLEQVLAWMQNTMQLGDEQPNEDDKRPE